MTGWSSTGGMAIPASGPAADSGPATRFDDALWAEKWLDLVRSDPGQLDFYDQEVVYAESS